ncbi:FAD-dependent oxidoreductase [Furfurilactobacillus entadae]|uniref:FAD-dependent oxidoreductase n=1 Tax=Furfurilactobacillus entadae TaxID=2922307 RepID=UPI0035EE1672
MKVIVLGFSHGGYEAVESLRLMDLDADIHWYDQQAFDIVKRNDAAVVEGIPAISSLTKTELNEQRITVFEQTVMTRIDVTAHTVDIKNLVTGKTATDSYDKLILSPGIHATKLPVPGVDLENVLTVHSPQDLMMTRKQAQSETIKNVVVIGAGYVGMSVADLFVQSKKHVTLIDVNQRPLSTYLDQEITAPLTEAMVADGVTMAMGESVTEMVGTDHVTAVQTATHRYPADLVILSAGGHANTDWLAETVALLPNGLIKTNEYMETSAPDIFAVGDATQIQYTPANTTLPVALSTNARRQAIFAVRNLMGQRVVFPGVQGTSALPAFGYKFATTGLSEKTAARLNVASASTVVKKQATFGLTEDVTFKLIYAPKTRQILGAQIISKQDLTANINTISLAIEMHATLDQLATADFFFQPELSTQWNVMSLAALQALKTCNAL